MTILLFDRNISQYAVELQYLELQSNAKCSRAGLESVERKHRASAAQMKYWGNKSEKKPVLEEEGEHLEARGIFFGLYFGMWRYENANENRNTIL